MQHMAMSGGRFEIALVPVVGGAAYGLESADSTSRPMPANPCDPWRRWPRGASFRASDWRSRSSPVQHREVPTLIFDEIDVGIGGGVAEIVGRLLSQLGETRQVLCVTHLPQVAAQARWQWSIAKENRDGQTFSRVKSLDDSSWVEEIAHARWRQNYRYNASACAGDVGYTSAALVAQTAASAAPSISMTPIRMKTTAAVRQIAVSVFVPGSRRSVLPEHWSASNGIAVPHLPLAIRN